MKNMKNLIKQHNARVLKNQEHSEKRSCNCRVKDNCPLDVVTNNECKEYFGTAFDFMIESDIFAMQHILIKGNSQGTYIH